MKELWYKQKDIITGSIFFILLILFVILAYYLKTPPEIEPVSTTPTVYELKRMRMLSAFIENCREDRYPEWRCQVFAKLAGFTDQELTRNSNE